MAYITINDQTFATDTAFPETREAALEMRVNQVVARWGENERAAATEAEGRKSYGRLVNSIVHDQSYDYGDSAPAGWRERAKAALTAADHAELRKGAW